MRLTVANKRLLDEFKEREVEAKPKKSVAKPAQVKKTATTDVLADRAKKSVAAAPQAGKEKEPRVLPKGFKIPKKLAEVADLYYEKKTERLSYNGTIKELQNVEGALAEYLIEKLPADEASGVAGKVARVSIKKKDVARVEDWSKLYAHIVANYNDHIKRKTGQQDGAFALLGRSVTDTAVQEAWEAKKQVPGVGKFTVKSISVNKL